jgi:predicted amidohydrolase
MQLTILELAATWGEAERVLDGVEAQLAAGPRTELVVLPEAALHGYVSASGDFDLTRFAEPIEGPTATRCAEIARRQAIHLIAPLVLREGEAIYNAVAGFGPDGEIGFVYRKRHPWFPERWATPGPSAPPVVTIAGRRVTIAICYDVHFLADDAIAELTGADVLVFPSAWVEQPDSRPALLGALAREFGVYIVNANWAPGVVRIPGQGGSCVVAPDGNILVRAPTAGRIDISIG